MREIRSRLRTRNEAAGILVTGAAKGLAPVDTGRLRSSVTHLAGEEQVVVGTNVEYAPFVHNGVRGRPPNPFLVNGLMNSVPALKRIYGGGA